MKKILLILITVLSVLTLTACDDGIEPFVQAKELFNGLKSVDLYRKPGKQIVSPAKENWVKWFDREEAPDYLNSWDSVFLKNEITNSNFSEAFNNQFEFSINNKNEKIKKELEQGITKLSFKLYLGTTTVVTGIGTHVFYAKLNLYIDNKFVEKISLKSYSESTNINYYRKNIYGDDFGKNLIKITIGDINKPKWKINKNTSSIKFIIDFDEEDKKKLFEEQNKKICYGFLGCRDNKIKRYYNEKSNDGIHEFKHKEFLWAEAYQNWYFDKSYFIPRPLTMNEVLDKKLMFDHNNRDPFRINPLSGIGLYIWNFKAFYKQTSK